MTDWNDRELNPLGLRLVENQSDRPMRVTVPVEVQALSYFISPEGNVFVCTFLNADRPREVYMVTDVGLAPVSNEEVRYIIGKWTNEILEAKRG